MVPATTVYTAYRFLSISQRGELISFKVQELVCDHKLLQ